MIQGTVCIVGLGRPAPVFDARNIKMDEQAEFLFAEGPAPEFHLPDPRSNLYQEVAALWQLPVGQVAHVDLNGHNMSDLQGRIDLARAPDLPLDRREALALRIGMIEFSSRQVVSWSLV